MQYVCPECDEVLEMPEEFAGQRVGCNKCHAKFDMPGPEPEPEHPEVPHE